MMFALVGTLAAAPVTRAQIVPVSLTHDALPDSKIPKRTTLLLRSPRIKPRRPVKGCAQAAVLFHERGVHAAAGLDMEETASLRPRFDEVDRLAKPFVGLPPAYYAGGALFATGVSWLGWKMARSPRWHKIWWVPQVTSIARKGGRILLHSRASDNELARFLGSSAAQ